jgi:hypothetical protein
MKRIKLVPGEFPNMIELVSPEQSEKEYKIKFGEDSYPVPSAEELKEEEMRRKQLLKDLGINEQ